MSNEETDFSELDGQLEMVVEGLAKKDKKKAVSYYMKESTIDRIKEAAKKYNMKDSQFLEEAICRLLDVIETKPLKQSLEEKPATKEEVISESKQSVKDEHSIKEKPPKKEKPTPWGRLNSKAKHHQDNGQEIIEKPIEENSSSNQKDLTEAEKQELKGQVLDYIFTNFKPDYRILYRRFEKLIKGTIEIEATILLTIIRELNQQSYVTFFEQQNLLDINKKIFEERMPNVADISKYFEDDNVIE
ncbi:hypothetical protein [Desulfuribacillus alkaliarsenatis]|uniref:Uncharacterized protein n=1 Tax=Desulfuribacillus alkaliarsenatis TaxID=766136 RepID=A0A1E5G3E5_9FIRM|nr:hypothetical protein [Desulfuribacillus alkaliarsenatis]OEF97504.1 hypothetical protein BHF68_04675 [Desulfuribacillus alkaliarsenatis]